ncbi:uncharacterized protein [Rutidosis leptorrhynchoides]|uniref:uncharacterized protein n=1 Tax=Rutidosis leptorrhynchoides TaxID=125765 RepID=UPI003A9A2917
MEPEKADSWEWLLSNNGTFATNILSTVLNSKILSAGTNREETLRNNLVPKKVEVFVWRTKKKRLPVLMELDKRGIDLHSVRCPVCDGDVESVDHAILFCKNTLYIWTEVFNWWGMKVAASLSIGEMFNIFQTSAMTELGAKIWQAVRWTCGYLIWRNRNQKVFKNKNWNPPVALNEIQITSFE